MKNTMISRSEILKLYTGMLSNISPHSLSQWLKSKTSNEYVVVPRAFVAGAIEYLEAEHNIEIVKEYL
jgi:hypothetical protein